jgi:hypothetical protein
LGTLSGGYSLFKARRRWRAAKPSGLIQRMTVTDVVQFSFGIVEKYKAKLTLYRATRAYRTIEV